MGQLVIYLFHFWFDQFHLWCKSMVGNIAMMWINGWEHQLVALWKRPWVEPITTWRNDYFKLGGIYFHFDMFITFSSSHPLGMVYKFLQDCFVVEDFARGFDYFCRYRDTLPVIMFLHPYHVCLPQHNYYLWRGRLVASDHSFFHWS